MPAPYPAQVREEALQWVLLGESSAVIAEHLGVAQRTITYWHREALSCEAKPGSVEAELQKPIHVRTALRSQKVLDSFAELRKHRALTDAETQQEALTRADLEAALSHIHRLTEGRGVQLPPTSFPQLTFRRNRGPNRGKPRVGVLAASAQAGG